MHRSGDCVGSGLFEEHGMAALAGEGSPRYERVPAVSLVDAYEPRIRELLWAFPRMPGDDTGIAAAAGSQFLISVGRPGDRVT